MNVTDIAKLYNIFHDKRWHDNQGHEIVFSNFCNLLANLTEEQRQLIIELAERYTWITYAEYQGKIINAFKKVEDDKLKSLKKIFLFPVMKPEDEDRTKSGHLLLYLLRAFHQLLPEYKHINFVEFESYENLTEANFTIQDGEAIFLLDDYLGSGETIKATLDKIFLNRKIEPRHLNVIAIASQLETFEFIQSIGIAIYADHIARKGISDYYTSPLLEEKTQIMLEIEKLIPIKHFSFGFNESEGLITLARTPDNTFPIFWKEHKKNNEKFEAPFARYN